MTANWWVNSESGQPVNVTEAQLTEMAAAGAITPATLVCPVGGTQWLPAGQLNWLAFPRGKPRAVPRATKPAPPRRTGSPRDEDATPPAARSRPRPNREYEDEPAPRTPRRAEGSLDLQTAIGFVFKDPRWSSPILLLALFQYVPILGYLVVRGWRLELARRVARGDRWPLPDWSEFGAKLGKGLLLAAVWALYQLPALIGSAVMFALVLLPYLRYLFDQDQRMEAQIGLSALRWALRLLLGLVLAAYAVAADVMFLVGQTRYIATDRAGAFFEFGTNFRILGRHLGLYARLFLFRFALNVVINLIRGLLAVTGVGAVFIPGLTSPPLHWTSGHLFGQVAAAIGSERRDEALEDEDRD
ncbi:MAG: DUF4013 domain-containing protein [Planctomycetes bacterium]|nr:DUF4013 domain-containing protein [Planctomycetota bacterium]